MGQRGFWDEEQRIQKLRHKKPVLTTLSDSIPWDSFLSLLQQGYTHERKSNAGRKRIDPLFLFKMLPPPSGKLSPVLLTTRGLKEMTSAALQRGCQS